MRRIVKYHSALNFTCLKYKQHMKTWTKDKRDKKACSSSEQRCYVIRSHNTNTWNVSDSWRRMKSSYNAYQNYVPVLQIPRTFHLVRCFCLSSPFSFFLFYYFCIYFQTTSFILILFVLRMIEESCNSNANEAYIKLSRRFFSWTQTFSLFVDVSIKRLENKRQKHREETKKVNISEWIYTYNFLVIFLL